MTGPSAAGATSLPGRRRGEDPRTRHLLAPGLACVLVISGVVWGARAAGNPLADTPSPTYGHNAARNNRSLYVGPQTMPGLKWSFSRSGDHWGTDYRQTGIGQSATVYLAAGMAGVYAIDAASGQMKWIFSPDDTGHETWVEFPPTVASDGTLYVASENDYAYGLNPSGGILWQFRAAHLHTPISISPDGTMVHFLSENGYVYALNRIDGSLAWRYQYDPRGIYGSGLRHPVVYDAADNVYFSWTNRVWSLTPTGGLRWVSAMAGSDGLIGPAVSNDGRSLYFVAGANVVALGTDGTVQWQYPLAATAFLRTPTIGLDGTIYIGAEDGAVYALNPGGGLRWKQRYVPVSGWGGGVKSNLLLDAAGTLFFYGKDGRVYAVSSQTQQLLWQYPTGQTDQSYPGLQLTLDTDGTLYVPVDERMMIALAASGGSPPAATLTAPPSPTASLTPSGTGAGPGTATTTPVATSPTASRTPTASPTATPTTSPTATLTGSAAGLNLLANASFEDDLDSDGIPDKWTVSGMNSSLVSRSTAQRADGTYALRASATGGQSFTIFQDVGPVSPGQIYTFSGLMNVPASSGSFRASIQLLAVNQWSGVNTTATALSQSSTTSGWVPASGSITIPNGAVALRVQLKLEYLKADVYVDRFIVTRNP